MAEVEQSFREIGAGGDGVPVILDSPLELVQVLRQDAAVVANLGVGANQLQQLFVQLQGALQAILRQSDGGQTFQGFDVLRFAIDQAEQNVLRAFVLTGAMAG